MEKKNEGQKFLPGTMIKIKKRDYWRWRVLVRYHMQPKFRINPITGLEIVKEGPKFYTDTDTHTHTQTHRVPFYKSCFSAKKQKQD